VVRRLLAALALVAFPFSAIAADNPDEACIRRLTNSERTQRGIPALTDNPGVDRIARRHAAEMAADRDTYHNTHLASDYNRELGGYKEGGENVGQGPDCETIHAAFMSSPGHKANILDRSYTQVGVGVRYDAEHTLYVVVDFFTPESKPRSKPTPSVKRCV